jgi:hypothetical protein
MVKNIGSSIKDPGQRLNGSLKVRNKYFDTAMGIQGSNPFDSLGKMIGSPIG